MFLLYCCCSYSRVRCCSSLLAASEPELADPKWIQGKQIFLDADHAIVISEPTGAPLPQGSFIVMLLQPPGAEWHTLSKKIGLLLLWPVVFVLSESKYFFLKLFVVVVRYIEHESCHKTQNPYKSITYKISML
jgi:hypothetical protein